MPFGQFVIGPPGSGKTTYCHGMEEFLSGIHRPPVIVNLDPANELNVPYECGVNIRSLVCLESVMEEFSLGPNGGLLYCMEYLEKNIEWLLKQLRKCGLHDHYFIFDLPGQIELYTTHDTVKNIITTVKKKLKFNVTVVNLIDSTFCLDSTKYISSIMVSLSTMICLEFPLVNVLTKVDLLKEMEEQGEVEGGEGEGRGKLKFDLSYYCEVQKLKYLIANESNSRHKKLNEALISVIENYDNVGFVPLDIQDKEGVLRVLKVVDKANGYIFGTLENMQNSVLNTSFFD